jgi:hypothetical protein
MSRLKKCLSVSMFVRELTTIEWQVEASHSFSIDTYLESCYQQHHFAAGPYPNQTELLIPLLHTQRSSSHH